MSAIRGTAKRHPYRSKTFVQSIGALDKTLISSLFSFYIFKKRLSTRQILV
ncbi:hypothetical protein [Sporolactobacillus pectinivorans]|uniref:hypothetical protein n=1 Tax=Sporolactobacillus pectinivorans TaxID=1591408 RepID=UPI0012FD9845|nr:hypothetical protein [Sporolactobacillus pectinivorans]